MSEFILKIVSNLLLLVCIHGAAIPKDNNRDYSNICEECYIKEFPVCPLDFKFTESSTISCQNLENNTCIFGIGNDETEKNQLDYVCLFENKANSLSSSSNSAESRENLIITNDTGDLKLTSVIKQTTEQTLLPITFLPINNVTKLDKIVIATSTKENSNFEIISVSAEPIVDMTVNLHGKDQNEFEFITILPTFTPQEHGNEAQIVEEEEQGAVTNTENVETLSTTLTPHPSTSSIVINTDSEAKPSESITNETTEPSVVNVVPNVETTEVTTTVKPPTETTTVVVPDNTTPKPLPIEVPVPTAVDIPLNKPVPVNISSAIRKCYACSSSDDSNCIKKPIRQLNCQLNDGIKNGCYTLFKADTNTTTRGCISELAEEGKNYCKTNVKLCSLCYEDRCNGKVAPSNGAILPTNWSVSMLAFITIIKILYID